MDRPDLSIPHRSTRLPRASWPRACPAHAGEQRRDHGVAARRARVRASVAVGHQPHRPLPAHGAAGGWHCGGQRRPRVVVAFPLAGTAAPASTSTHLQSERRPYDKWIAYGQSKRPPTALFAVALDARGEPHRVRAFAVHPGAVMTDLVRSIPSEELQAIRTRLVGSTYKTTEQGAATSIWCATSRKLDRMGASTVGRRHRDPRRARCADSARRRAVKAMDPDAAERLWGLSEGGGDGHRLRPGAPSPGWPFQ